LARSVGRNARSRHHTRKSGSSRIVGSLSSRHRMDTGSFCERFEGNRSTPAGGIRRVSKVIRSRSGGGAIKARGSKMLVFSCKIRL
jgi:hypothetical protein